jgi:hypothetical protein
MKVLIIRVIMHKKNINMLLKLIRIIIVKRFKLKMNWYWIRKNPVRSLIHSNMNHLRFNLKIWRSRNQRNQANKLKKTKREIIVMGTETKWYD